MSDVISFGTLFPLRFNHDAMHICSAPCADISVRSISTRNALQGTFKKISSFRFLKGFDYAIKIIRFIDSTIYIRTSPISLNTLFNVRYER